MQQKLMRTANSSSTPALELVICVSLGALFVQTWQWLWRSGALGWVRGCTFIYLVLSKVVCVCVCFPILVFRQNPAWEVVWGSLEPWEPSLLWRCPCWAQIKNMHSLWDLCNSGWELLWYLIYTNRQQVCASADVRDFTFGRVICHSVGGWSGKAID